MFHVPNKYRIHKHLTLGSDDSAGNNGAFEFQFSSSKTAFVIASDGSTMQEPYQWEHVSVHMTDHNGRNFTPSWSDMCAIKDLFWDEEDCVVQYHPPKSEYVNNHAFTLHLWRPVNVEIPTPPKIFVGV